MQLCKSVIKTLDPSQNKTRGRDLNTEKDEHSKCKIVKFYKSFTPIEQFLVECMTIILWLFIGLSLKLTKLRSPRFTFTLDYLKQRLFFTVDPQ